MRVSHALVYRVLGGVFLFLGAYTLLNAAVAWRAAGVILWPAVAYAVLDLLLGWGLWERQRWLVLALAVNLAGMAALAAVRLTLMPASIYGLFGLALDAFLFWYVYATRKTLGRNGHAWVAPLFYLVWIIITGYNIYLAL